MDGDLELSDTRGPLSQRKCKDLLWLVLFVLYFLGMGFVGYSAVTTGDLNNLIFPLDSNDQYCGKDNSLSNPDRPNFVDKPYLFYINPLNLAAKKMCVSECPDKTIITNLTTTICFSSRPTNITYFNQAVRTGMCTAVNYESSPVFYRCIPNDINEIAAVLNRTVDQSLVDQVVNVADVSAQIVSDFARTWWWFLVFAGFAAAVSFVYLILLRLFAALFVWLVVGLSLICVDGLAVFFYFTWQESMARTQSRGFSTSTMTREQQTYFAFFVTSCVIATFVTLLVIVLRNRIRIAIEVLKESSKAMQAMPLMVLCPVLIFVLTLALFCYWVVMELYLASALKDPQLGDSGYNLEYLKYFQWYLLFGFFWGQQFLSGINQCTISGAVSSWYWTLDKKNLPLRPILTALGRVLRYHLGSISLGSLVIAVIEFLRTALYIIQRQVKGANSKWAKSLIACCQCFLSCLEAIMRYVNKNAYVEISIYGLSFCKASAQAFTLLVRNSFRLVAVESVSSFILFLGKVVVTAISGCGSYFTFKLYYADNPLMYSSASVFVVMVTAFVVTSIFMSVYDTSIDTIFICFCEDCEKNDGSPARPYYMSASLKAITDVKNVPNKRATNRVEPMQVK